jgi:hypothetical protein
MSMTASTSSISSGSPITLTATVQGSSKTVAPTGTVAFSDDCCHLAVPGTVNYSTIAGSNGNLKLQAEITFMPSGSDYYQGTYSGDGNYPGSSVQMGSQVMVNGNDFNITASPPSLTVARGQTANETLTVSTQSNTAAITFSSACTGLPSESTCAASFLEGNNDNVTFNTSLSVTTVAPHPLFKSPASQQSQNIFPLAAGPFVMALCFFTLKRSKGATGLMLLLMLVGLGCGGGASGGGGGGGGRTDPGTPVGSYTVTITATTGSGSTAISHSTTFTLVVQ